MGKGRQRPGGKEEGIERRQRPGGKEVGKIESVGQLNVSRPYLKCGELWDTEGLERRRRLVGKDVGNGRQRPGGKGGSGKGGGRDQEERKWERQNAADSSVSPGPV